MFRELNGEIPSERVIPDAEESKTFWGELWGNEKEHNRKAACLEELRRKKRNVKQDNVTITEEKIRSQSKRMANWKAPGPDGVQGVWLKKLTSLHGRIAEQLDDVLNGRKVVPEWMTLGKTILCLKDPDKGNVVDNYRPISCLPLMCKLLTGGFQKACTTSWIKITYCQKSKRDAVKAVEGQKISC